MSHSWSEIHGNFSFKIPVSCVHSICIRNLTLMHLFCLLVNLKPFPSAPPLEKMAIIYYMLRGSAVKIKTAKIIWNL